MQYFNDQTQTDEPNPMLKEGFKWPNDGNSISHLKMVLSYFDSATPATPKDITYVSDRQGMHAQFPEPAGNVLKLRNYITNFKAKSISNIQAGFYPT